MKRQWRIVGLLFLAASGLLAVSVLAAYWMGLIAIEDNRDMTAQLFVSSHLANFLSALKDAETGQRGFLLTGEDSYLEPYQQGLARVQTEENALRQLAATGVLPRNDVDRVMALTQEKLAIGLAIVRKVVERMSGKVGVESEPGHGSRFWVELRAAQPNIQPKTDHEP